MTTSPGALPPSPTNEKILNYAPGSKERKELAGSLVELADSARALELVIGGQTIPGHGASFVTRAPHRHSLTLGSGHQASEEDVQLAVDTACMAAADWASLPFESRASIFLKAADLLSGPWRASLNAATILGQSKSVFQAEIDAAAELCDFWRFNVHYARQIMNTQPISPSGNWNRLDYRPLEGFVLAISPFNFTSIAGNLPTAPALMGNTVVWKPSLTQQLAASLIMELLGEAGLPPGVINMVTGDGPAVSRIALPNPEFAGLHFTGSTATFQRLWQQIATNLGNYHTYPRIVGETGGKNFIVAHPSADPAALATALLRGAFEYQGQKCSAASRAYIPSGMWEKLKHQLADEAESIPMGDPAEFGTFLGAVIDERAFQRISGALAAAQKDPALKVVTGGGDDSREGWFIAPTILETSDPHHELMQKELFGPVLTVFPYSEDLSFGEVLRMVDRTSSYGLTGSVFATDRAAIDQAESHLRHAAGNFYINDKPTGAVVGQQPFGGARGSGTNDKAGSPLNLERWISPRAIKETFVPPTRWEYVHLLPE